MVIISVKIDAVSSIRTAPGNEIYFSAVVWSSVVGYGVEWSGVVCATNSDAEFLFNDVMKRVNYHLQLRVRLELYHY